MTGGTFDISESSTKKSMTLKEVTVGGYKLTGTVEKVGNKPLSDLGTSGSDIAKKLAGNWAIEGKSGAGYSGYIVVSNDTAFLSAFLASDDKYDYPVIDKTGTLTFKKLAVGLYEVEGFSAEKAYITVFGDNATLHLTDYLVRPIGSTADYKLSPALKLEKFAPTAVTMAAADFVGTWTVSLDYSSASSVGKELVVKTADSGLSATLGEDAFEISAPVSIGTNVFSLTGNGDQFVFFMDSKTAGRMFLDATVDTGNNSVTYAVLATVAKKQESASGDDTPSDNPEDKPSDNPSDTPSEDNPSEDPNGGIETPGVDIEDDPNGIETPGVEL